MEPEAKLTPHQGYDDSATLFELESLTLLGSKSKHCLL